MCASAKHRRWHGREILNPGPTQLAKEHLSDHRLARTRTPTHYYDFVRVILASTQDNTEGDVQFIEVTDGPEFRTDLHQALRDGLTALGLLGWEFKDGTLQAKGGLLPWHDESLKELFERVSEAGVDRVQELLEMLRAE